MGRRSRIELPELESIAPPQSSAHPHLEIIRKD
jgi:hypothetical protein